MEKGKNFNLPLLEANALTCTGADQLGHQLTICTNLRHVSGFWSCRGLGGRGQRAPGVSALAQTRLWFSQCWEVFFFFNFHSLLGHITHFHTHIEQAVSILSAGGSREVDQVSQLVRQRDEWRAEAPRGEKKEKWRKNWRVLQSRNSRRVSARFTVVYSRCVRGSNPECVCVPNRLTTLQGLFAPG